MEIIQIIINENITKEIKFIYFTYVWSETWPPFYSMYHMADKSRGNSYPKVIFEDNHYSRLEWTILTFRMETFISVWGVSELVCAILYNPNIICMTNKVTIILFSDSFYSNISNPLSYLIFLLTQHNLHCDWYLRKIGINKCSQLIKNV